MISHEQRRPALFEGIAIMLIEAAHAGRTFMAEASGGCADAAVHGDTGLLMDPDTVDDVVQAIRRLLDDHQTLTASEHEHASARSRISHGRKPSRV